MTPPLEFPGAFCEKIAFFSPDLGVFQRAGRALCGRKFWSTRARRAILRKIPGNLRSLTPRNISYYFRDRCSLVSHETTNKIRPRRKTILNSFFISRTKPKFRARTKIRNATSLGTGVAGKGVKIWRPHGGTVCRAYPRLPTRRRGDKEWILEIITKNLGKNTWTYDSFAYLLALQRNFAATFNFNVTCTERKNILIEVDSPRDFLYH